MPEIIIRTFKNSIMDTSKQRAIEICCETPNIQAVKDNPSVIRVYCIQCGTDITEVMSWTYTKDK